MERFWYFLIPLAVLVAAEAIWPRRRRELTRLARWSSALLLMGIGIVFMRLLVPAGLVGIALLADTSGFGLFNQVAAPLWLVAIGGYVLFDFAVWAQHVVMHRVDFFWRFHRVHHADPDFDVFTALRFHPGEFLISLVWKGTVIALIGAPAIFVLWYEVLLNVGAMFNHSNLKLPLSLDRWLRLGVVTPDMHRVHHSTDHVEANRNFGFFIPWWDRLFGVYQSQPASGHEEMQIGQREWRETSDQSIWALLVQPRYKP